MEKIRDSTGCPPDICGTDECFVFRTTGECFEDIHHEFHPRREYKTGLERKFREIPEFKTILCRASHQLIHAMIDKRIEPLPEKPDRVFMLNALQEARRSTMVNN